MENIHLLTSNTTRSTLPYAEQRFYRFPPYALMQDCITTAKDPSKRILECLKMRNVCVLIPTNHPIPRPAGQSIYFHHLEYFVLWSFRCHCHLLRDFCILSCLGGIENMTRLR